MTDVARLLRCLLPAVAAAAVAVITALPVPAAVTSATGLTTTGLTTIGPTSTSLTSTGLTTTSPTSTGMTSTGMTSSGAFAAGSAATQADEWWLTTPHARAWNDAPAAGNGVTAVVLSTGVDGSHPDLTGSVVTGPNLGNTGRKTGITYWGDEGAAVADLIAAPGHGAGDTQRMTGIAPKAHSRSWAAMPTAARGIAPPPASRQADPGHLLRTLVRDLLVTAAALIACLIGAITLTRFRRRPRSTAAARIAAARPADRLGRHARNGRRQPGTPGADATATAEAGMTSYRLRRPPARPPWPPARPPDGPLTLLAAPTMLPPTVPSTLPSTKTPTMPSTMPSTMPPAPRARPEDTSLAPWERSPAEHLAAPVYENVAPWPVSNTGPMYVWNPAATTLPLNITGLSDSQAPRDITRPPRGHQPNAGV